MRDLPRPWEAATDPHEREAHASEQLELALDFTRHPIWQQLAEELTAQITDTLKDLARSARDDEQNRGVIRALEHALSMPENLIRAVSVELDTHR